jgi:putative pyruvate formate lyase activating enzyme
MAEDIVNKEDEQASGNHSREKLNSSPDFMKLFEECRLCPRECGINRMQESAKARSGFCRQDYRLRVAHVGAHFGEEPPISGTRGSGTIFFSGCSLRCSFCQNHQISLDGAGDILSIEDLFERVLGLIGDYNVHNVNLVTPDHFFPYTFRLVELLRENGVRIPILYNTSGYQSITMLKTAEDYADIYMPDYKYADSEIARSLSKCADYPGRALEAISEMVRQKGFLDSFDKGTDVATKGVLVRHLILPGKVRNSLDALSALFLEFGSGIPISLMSQYHPIAFHKDPDMNRRITREEFDRVYNHSLELGLKNMYVQFPADYPHNDPPFLPDFQEDEPFPGNDPEKEKPVSGHS